MAHFGSSGVVVPQGSSCSNRDNTTNAPDASGCVFVVAKARVTTMTKLRGSECRVQWAWPDCIELNVSSNERPEERLYVRPRRLVLAMALAAAGCAPMQPDSGLFAPSVHKCQSQGCNWVDAKAARLSSCKAKRPPDVIDGAECMAEFISYHGTTPCKDTRAWLARLQAGIPEDQ